MKFLFTLFFTLMQASLPASLSDGHRPPLQQRDRRPAVDGYQVTATAYSFREPEHHRYGRLNCLGTPLDDTQVAADTRYYPLGTVLWIQGLGRRTVTDRGSAVRGPRHIDIHFSSLAAMRAWGTRRVHIRILFRA